MMKKSDGHRWSTSRVQIDGMHCANCEILIERKFRKIAGVRRVRASHASRTAEIVAYGNVDIRALQSAVADDGYTVLRMSERTTKPPEPRNTQRDYMEIGAVFLIFAALYVVLQTFDLLPDRLAIPGTISYGLAFLIGVVASISTCIAVTGGLLVAVAAKYNAASRHYSPVQSFKPHIYFNAGRLLSYTFLGGAIGALGSTFTLSAEANGLLILVASGIMIVLGLQMLNLSPSFKLFQLRMPKFLAHKIHDQAERKAQGGAFILGASTFFLPCGFTQALQLYVLAQGSFVTGALTMLAFSLGTLPALLSLSAMSSFAAGGFQRYFLKVAGAAVVILGFFNLQSGLTLATIDGGASASVVEETLQTANAAEETVPIVDGKQIIDMKIIGYTYEPHHFFVRQGLPVEWRIDASLAAGCGHMLIAPKAHVRRRLPSGPTIVTFMPQELGEIRFNCGMGMMTRSSKITVLPSEEKKLAESQPAVERTVAQAGAELFSSRQRDEIERITREYLIQHPEVLQEAIAALDRRQQAADAEARGEAVKAQAATLFNSPRQVVIGDLQGDVTMVEFFDYNCPYCKRALTDMVDLLKTDTRLRIVLKELPVLGEGSTEAAQVATAVRMQDATGRKYLEFHQKLLGGRGQANRARALAVANEVGLDMTRLEQDMASDEVKATIAESLKLAEALGINGTPSYVIGSDVIVGAVGLEALREKINTARSNGASANRRGDSP
jgi:protein-disulfide isomerase/sulfite exporter TauE/SafE/copper chaperone CopZ